MLAEEFDHIYHFSIFLRFTIPFEHVKNLGTSLLHESVEENSN